MVWAIIYSSIGSFEAKSNLIVTYSLHIFNILHNTHTNNLFWVEKKTLFLTRKYFSRSAHPHRCTLPSIKCCKHQCYIKDNMDYDFQSVSKVNTRL